MEIACWWNGDHTVPPCFSGFYSGPDKTVILTTAIGYKISIVKKQHHTCIALLELELVKQFLHTVADTSFYTLFTSLKTVLVPTSFYAFCSKKSPFFCSEEVAFNVPPGRVLDNFPGAMRIPGTK